MDSTNIKKLQDNLIQAIEIVVDKKLESQTKIYNGFILSIEDNGKCKVSVNGNSYILPFYGIGYIQNRNVKVVVPQGNMSVAYCQGDGKVYISSEEPSGAKDGDIWIEV